MDLKEVILTCYYPDDSCDAAIPEKMTVDQLCFFLKQLAYKEKDLRSFTLTAVVADR